MVLTGRDSRECRKSALVIRDFNLQYLGGGSAIARLIEDKVRALTLF